LALWLFSSSALQLFSSSALQLFSSSALQLFSSSALQLFSSSALQLFSVSVYRGTSAIIFEFVERRQTFSLRLCFISSDIIVTGGSLRERRAIHSAEAQAAGPERAAGMLPSGPAWAGCPLRTGPKGQRP